MELMKSIKSGESLNIPAEAHCLIQRKSEQVFSLWDKEQAAAAKYRASLKEWINNLESYPLSVTAYNDFLAWLSIGEKCGTAQVEMLEFINTVIESEKALRR